MSTSLSTAVPTVNVVMAFDIEVIHLLKQSQTLEIFEEAVAKKFTNKQVLVFRNGPASDFISLRHTWDKMPVIELEFLDPETTFESDLFSTDVNQLMPLQADLASQLMAKDQAANAKPIPASGKKQQNIENRIKRLEKEQTTKSDPTAKEIAKATKSIAKLKAELEVARGTSTDWVPIAASMDGMKNLDKLYMIEQMNAQKKLMQRTVYITYGLGNNFLNWAPVICFSTAVGMEYNYTGAGARILKLIYSAAGIDANLTSLGISPLKALGIGQVLRGQSMPLFNKEVMEKRLTTYQEGLDIFGREDTIVALDRLFSDPYVPCIHDVVCDIFKDYITGATNYTNVLIVLPDLNKLLQKDYISAIDAAIMQANAGNPPRPEAHLQISIAGWKQFIEKYGMRMVETKKAVQSPTNVVVGANVEANNPFPISIEDHYKKYEVRTVFSSNTQGDLLMENKLIEPLMRVCNKIAESLIPTTKTPFRLNVDFSVENDWETLKLMKEAGLIDELKPLLIFGDKIFIDRYLYGSSLDDAKDTSTAGKKANESVLSVSPVDIAKGLDDVYMHHIHNIRNPPLWVTPFGPVGNIDGQDEYFLTDDTNIKVDAFEAKSDYQKATMPVFTLGTRNSNILSINLDINSVYLTLINKFKYQTINASQIINAVIPKNTVTPATKGNLAKLATVLTGKTDDLGIPDGFRDIIKPYLWKTEFAKDMKQVFKSLGIDDFGTVEKKSETKRYAAFKDNQAILRKQGMSLKNLSQVWQDYQTDERILYFWKRFEALQAQYPGVIMQLGGADTTQGAINHNALVTEAMSGMAFTGMVKTLPMFHLSNYRNVIMRDVLLYSIEPRIVGVSDIDIKNQQAWFSGVYQLTGFTHTISKSSVTSEFSIVKTPGKSIVIEGSNSGGS